MPAVITLLTDFGTRDSYVAQMKGVILSLNDACQVVDASHDIPPQDIWVGGLCLREYSWLYPPGTVHVAVVDPGVGTQRRIVAVQIGEQRYVLPDNGLLTFLMRDFGIQQAVVVSQKSHWREEISSTFHGRDIMAPVAARLAAGLPLTELGPPAGELIRLPLAEPDLGATQAVVQVVAIDRFGNIMTNLPAQWLDASAARTRAAGMQSADGSSASLPKLWLEIQGQRVAASLVGTYGQAPANSLVMLQGSQGRIEVAISQGNAAARLGLKVGEQFDIHTE